MASHAVIEHDSVPKLLTLPNELLSEVVSSLETPDLRLLGRVNRQLYSFVDEYLGVHRYNMGLMRLPPRLFHIIVEHLATQANRSRFARASQRFYHLTMDYVFRYSVQHSQSDLLNYAARRNVIGMARSILNLGGNVDTRRGSNIYYAGQALTPLAVVAHRGHERMARLFIAAGASQLVAGIKIPLICAILGRQERTATILAQNAGATEVIRKGQTVLQLASRKKLACLVQNFLDRGPGKPTNVCTIHDRSAALFHLLDSADYVEEFVKKSLQPAAYRIVLLLLQSKADPDVHFEDRFGYWETASQIAPRFPDPRVRNLLLEHRSTHSPTSTESSLRIGRTHLDSVEWDSALSCLPYRDSTTTSPIQVTLNKYLNQLREEGHLNSEGWNWKFEY